MQHRVVYVLSIIGLSVPGLSLFNLIYNLKLLNRYKQRSFFKKRSIKLLIFTIIPSAIEVFIAIPVSILSIGLDIIECTELTLNLQLLFHTTLINLWINYLFTRLWHVFVRIRKYQDLLQWKEV